MRQLSSLLAARLGLPLLEPAAAGAATGILEFTDRGLQLRVPSLAGRPLRVDFASGAATYRRKKGGGGGQAVARAVGVGRGITSVIDATAGLGGDGFVLASLGCRVLMLERSPLVAELLADGLRRGQSEPAISAIVARMTLLPGDSLALLRDPAMEAADCVYLDPMYPESGRQALAKKEMRILRLLAGDDQDADSLLAAALDKATKRVVVKRPRHAPPLAGAAPSHALSGESSRFDVYLCGRGRQ
ncbi:MAG: class I SAM-dependent methyltransferase [Thermodesulfobacteriota bacterium]